MVGVGGLPSSFHKEDNQRKISHHGPTHLSDSLSLLYILNKPLLKTVIRWNSRPGQSHLSPASPGGCPACQRTFIISTQHKIVILGHFMFLYEHPTVHDLQLCFPSKRQIQWGVLRNIPLYVPLSHSLKDRKRRKESMQNIPIFGISYRVHLFFPNGPTDHCFFSGLACLLLLPNPTHMYVYTHISVLSIFNPRLSAPCPHPER